MPPSFFPRQTIEWRREEAAAFRRISLSLPEMAIVAGVLLRILRAAAFSGGSASWTRLGAFFVIGLILLIGAATAHLANYPIKHWLWRAPAFAALEAAGEMLMSLALIAAGREPEGTARAELHDWPAMAARALLQSEAAICLWALVLAGVIVLVRRSGVAGDVEEPEAPSGD